MLFVMNALADLGALNALPGCEDATPETVEAVLEEHGRFCSEVIAPLNHSADREPGSWQDGKVTTAKGFKEAFQAFGAAGWQGIQHPAEIGGQNLPKLVAAACMEMLNSANLSFALCPLLTDGAIEALSIAGNDTQKQTYLPHLVSGEWTGTMNLTEPQAGSDLAMVRSRAVPQPDGTYRIFGTKIFITYGEHDMAENIVHLVLARTPDAPEGVKGISLFVVPKFLVNSDGSLGARNDVQCVALEHKLGIRASPTVVLQFGEQGGAVGTLVGEESRGLETMFIMMNAARFSVGMQGIGLAERAYQKAVRYAKERVQSRDLEGSPGPVTIIHQPDVRRMLMTMRAQTEAARALAYVTAAAFDIAHHHPDASVRKEKQAFYEFMVPIVKGWATEMAVDVASTGVQVHGGMGFIEETGAAQYYRDARILTIYEGTTAIQANDLVGRKTVRDGGATARAVLGEVRRIVSELAASGSEDLRAISIRLGAAAEAMEAAVNFATQQIASHIKDVYAGSVPYLKLCGITLGGWQIARAALAAARRLANGIETDAGDPSFFEAKIATARFYADHVLPQAAALCTSIVEGSKGVLALSDEQF
jgi:alkylation response protein AidB-like acyl-CoA dehydrogenase